MHQFHINLPIRQLEERLAKDCYWNRHVPGYFGKDYRAILAKKVQPDDGQKPFRWGISLQYTNYRFFCYELLACGEATTIAGRFVWPVLARWYTLWMFVFFFAFLFITSRKTLSASAFLLILIAFVAVACVGESLNRRIRKKDREEEETALLDYFSELEQQYPVP